MTILKNLSISGLHGKPILTDIFYRKNKQKKPIVIFAHGYKGYKDWGAWNLVAEQFAKAGVFFVKFNFSHNGGTVEQPIDFPDLEAFGNNNFIKELDDLKSVIDWIFNKKSLHNEADTSNVTLIGHSRGGGIVMLKAAEDSRISKVITWSAVSDYGSRFPKGNLLADWQQKGVSYVFNSRTKQQMPLYYQFYQNFLENKERLNIARAVKKIKIPQLIIHGEADETVKLQEAKNIHKWNPNSKLLLIKEAGHTYNSKHPWEVETIPDVLKFAISQTLKFIE